MGRCTTTSIDTFFSGAWKAVLENALVEGAEWADIEPDPACSIASNILAVTADP
jgi:hypothetical protein